MLCSLSLTETFILLFFSLSAQPESEGCRASQVVQITGGGGGGGGLIDEC